MKHGNWQSRRSYKRDLNGCHRMGPPIGRGKAYNPTAIPERSLGAIAAQIAAAMMNPFRGGNR